MVNLEWYRSFVEVYRVGTASGAAEVLHLTQPAVSQHLAALEAALGQPLFLRQIRSAVAAGFGLSVLPDYLCEKMVATARLTLILNPKKAVKNQLWLAYKKSDRQSMQVKLLQDLLVSRNETMGSVKL
jgi:DNA-binding transcriptional LysR family regulator